MLIDKIKIDRLAARRAGDTALAQLLTTFYSEAAMVGKNDGNRDSTDREVQAVAKKFIKNSTEVLDNVASHDVRALAAIYEIDTLKTFLPPQLSDEEVAVAVGAIIQARGLSTMKDLGIVMKELKSAFDGQYDGKVAKEAAQELLK